MAYLSDDELPDTESDFTGWDDEVSTGAAAETLERALAEERLAELERELEQDEHPVDYDAELETEEEEAAPVSEKRLKLFSFQKIQKSPGKCAFDIPPHSVVSKFLLFRASTLWGTYQKRGLLQKASFAAGPGYAVGSCFPLLRQGRG